ncbi:hypothetical protein BKA70DRAFT_1272794 [Coprinopsis sp. MPI-PUGE-AT-0042]|nr:hypothetical protein BKA70DRAFT_1272794 [Coprinopsis sp. MPI-PUGE-AT-0042]
MAKITDLPPELLCRLADEAHQKDIFQLRLVCKSLSSSLASQALSRVVIAVGTPFGGRDEGPGMNALGTLSEVKDHLVQLLARTLSINRLAPPANVESDALSKLLQSALEYIAHPRETPLPNHFALSVVLALVPLLASIEEIELTAFQKGQLPILSGINRLTKLHISLQAIQWRGMGIVVGGEIAGAIDRSWDTLEDLKLEKPPGGIVSHSFPRLRSLSLTAEACAVVLPADMPFPQLPSLQFLHLKPCLGGADHLQRVDNFFTFLQGSAIRLKGVEAPATRSLIRYLDSYEDGLQELEIHSDYRGSIDTAGSRPVGYLSKCNAWCPMMRAFP